MGINIYSISQLINKIYIFSLIKLYLKIEHNSFMDILMNDLFKIYFQNLDVKPVKIELYSQIIKDYNNFLIKKPSE